MATTMTHQEINGKHIYKLDGEVVRNSKRDYKFALLGAPRIELGATGNGPFRCIGFGNNAKTLLSSWKSIYRYMEFNIVTIERI